MLETLDVDEAVDAKPRGVWYVDSPEFHEPDAKQRIRRPVDTLYRDEHEEVFFEDNAKGMETVSPHHPILTQAGERHLFRLMNFTRFQMNELWQSIDGKLHDLKSRDQRWMAVATRESATIGNTIAEANLRLCAYWARRLRKDGENSDDLYEELLTPLERSIRRFDYMRETTFATFATKSMRSHLQRMRQYAYRDNTHFPTGYDLSCAQDDFSPEGVNSVVRDKLIELVHRLPSEQARTMIKDYFALGDSPEPMTHQQIADKFGCKKQNSVGVIARALKMLQCIARKLGLREEDFMKRIPWNELENE